MFWVFLNKFHLDAIHFEIFQFLVIVSIFLAIPLSFQFQYSFLIVLYQQVMIQGDFFIYLKFNGIAY
ncbi:hypothetical protein pb186bvf_016745 [Paramecium bursaria]